MRLRALVAGILCVAAGTSCGDGVDLPDPSRPELLTVRSGGNNIPVAADGSFGVLPTRPVELELRAPWPADLELSLDTGEKLTRLHTDRPDWIELDREDLGGWWAKAIDPDSNPPKWTILVSPPPSRRLNSERIRLQIRSVSLDTSLPEPDRVSEPLNVVLAKSSPLPRTGTIYLALTPQNRDSAATDWVADLAFQATSLPAMAVIETVTNDSAVIRTTDEGGETRDAAPLQELRYSVEGQSRATALNAGQTSTAFAPLRASGSFRGKLASVGFICIPIGTGPRRSSVSEVGCVRPEVRLRVVWRRP